MLSVENSTFRNDFSLCDDLFKQLCSPTNLRTIVACWSRHVPRTTGSPDLTNACSSVMSAICSKPQLEVHDTYIQLFDRTPSMRIQLDTLDPPTAKWIKDSLNQSTFSNMEIIGPPYAEQTRRYGFLHASELVVAYNTNTETHLSYKRIFLLAYVLIHVEDVECLGDRSALRTIESALQQLWITQDTAARIIMTRKDIDLANALTHKKFLKERLSTADYSELYFDIMLKRWRTKARINKTGSQVSELSSTDTNEENKSTMEKRTTPASTTRLTFGRMALKNASVRLKAISLSPATHLTLSLESLLAKVEKVLEEYNEILCMAEFIVNLTNAVIKSRQFGFDVSHFSLVH